MKKNSRTTILLIEDDALFRQAMHNFLADKYSLVLASSAEEALKILPDATPNLILLDITLPGLDGISLLKQIKNDWPEIPVIMMTAVDRIPTVVECIKLGAHDYLAKPIIADELIMTIDRALENYQLRDELERRRKLQLLLNKEYQIVGDSDALRKLLKQIELVGKSDSTVLIEGETGTGKELVARAIYACSSRASGPFVAINCGAIPKDLLEAEFFGYKKGAFTGAASDEIGKFQLADGGTLLLDEISELSHEAQAKLLRVLEKKEFYPVGSNKLVAVDVRVIASTNRSLHEMVEQKIFREDLYFRLNVYTIPIPPLRQRTDDIIPLAEHFLREFNLRFGKSFVDFEPDVKNFLIQQQWKGNVRELRNFMERIVLSSHGNRITKDHLNAFEHGVPKSTAPAATLSLENGLDAALGELEKNTIVQTLAITKGNKTKAAKMLQLSLPAFYYRLEKYQLL